MVLVPYPIGGEVFDGENIMRYLIGAIILAASLVPASAQNMNADDLKWVNQCITDNRGEPGATPAIARAYCICMNEKMSSNETRSITQWEKSNPAARKACETQAGWK